MLPGPILGSLTAEVGLFRTQATELAHWVVETTRQSEVREPALRDLADAEEVLSSEQGPGRLLLFVPWQEWTLLLTSGPRGTDVGLIPTRVARRRGEMAIRAVVGGTTSPGTILEVYHPESVRDSRLLRSIAAVLDSRWVFETFGDPLPFEELSAYENRRIADRFTAQMLDRYLDHLGAPRDIETLDVGAALLVATGLSEERS